MATRHSHPDNEHLSRAVEALSSPIRVRVVEALDQLPGLTARELAVLIECPVTSLVRDLEVMRQTGLLLLDGEQYRNNPEFRMSEELLQILPRDVQRLVVNAVADKIFEDTRHAVDSGLFTHESGIIIRAHLPVSADALEPVKAARARLHDDLAEVQERYAAEDPYAATYNVVVCGYPGAQYQGRNDSYLYAPATPMGELGLGTPLLIPDLDPDADDASFTYACEKADEVFETFAALHALSHPERLLLFGVIERNAGAPEEQLAKLVGRSIDVVQYQLRILLEAGVIEPHGQDGYICIAPLYVDSQSLASTPGLFANTMYTAAAAKVLTDTMYECERDALAHPMSHVSRVHLDLQPAPLNALRIVEAALRRYYLDLYDISKCYKHTEVPFNVTILGYPGSRTADRHASWLCDPVTVMDRA